MQKSAETLQTAVGKKKDQENKDAQLLFKKNK